MSELKDREVIREPLDPAEGVREVEEAFQFNNAPTEKQILKCGHLERYARGLAYEIAAIVPLGKCQTVAINNVLGALMWARHGILAEREVQLGTTEPMPGPDATEYIIAHPGEFTTEQVAQAIERVNRGKSYPVPVARICPGCFNPVIACSCESRPVPCCERDTNRDGNCDVHKVPASGPVPGYARKPDTAK